MDTRKDMNEPTAKATWIWYPGDFEVWLGNRFNNRRTERGAMFPPFWKQDSHWPTVEFSRSFVLDDAETISIACEGHYNLMLDGRLQFGMPKTFYVPAGEHQLNLKVWNQYSPPALYIAGKVINTDNSWRCTYEDKIWIDEAGIAHGAGTYVPAASWDFNSPDVPPSNYHLRRAPLQPINSRKTGNGTLYDFGRETFGYVIINGLRGTLHIYYGESAEEALDKEHCETLDIIHEGEVLNSKAFRYVYVEEEEGSGFDELLMDYEYAPHDLQHSGSFRCNDDELNRIWDISAYTLDLTTREFFLDGIKRDRWTWSGDAIQSYLMNYYLRFDTECVKRTIRQLRGKDPVTAHVNTIMDYTFYWFKSVLDYYDYTADIAFVREMWPRMVSLMDYVVGRTNDEGMAEGQADDWIFVDWVDFPMHKRGTLCFEQILFYKALETMSICATLLGETDHYARRAIELRKHIKDLFWDNEKKAYTHAIEDGTKNRQVTKFPNMFAILYGLSDTIEQEQIMQHVMLNACIDPITTPYMRFYELEALCMAGLQERVLHEMKAYWGGMIKEGATTFWEKYNPEETGIQHLAMYGRPYGKSLCHAWGASPLYLLGKYFLGVKPTKPGYEEYEVRPALGGLEWMEGCVPTPHGLIRIHIDRHQISIYADEGIGFVVIAEKKYRIEPGKEYVLTCDA